MAKWFGFVLPCADGGVLDLEPQALRKILFFGRLREGLEEVDLVVDHLELEARRLADDVADLAERGFVVAGDLDDDVLVADRDALLL